MSHKDVENEIKNLNDPDVKLYKSAVWIEECKKEMWLGVRKRADGTHKERGSASLHDGKGYLGEEKAEVDCINFGKWIKDNFSKDDNIYLRMDIEGSEYTVLPSMIEDGSIDYINNLSVEFHWRKFCSPNRELFKKIHQDLYNYFNSNKNIKYEEMENMSLKGV